MATCSAIFNEPRWLRDQADLLDQALWWIGRDASPEGRLRRERPLEAVSRSGTACMEDEDVQAILDSGPFGWAGAGHSHSDTLSLVLRRATKRSSSIAERILIFRIHSGETGFAVRRRIIRSASMYGTKPSLPDRFVVHQNPMSSASRGVMSEEEDFLDAAVRYTASHTVARCCSANRIIRDQDEVTGPAGCHDIEQFWHFGVAVHQVVAIMSYAPAHANYRFLREQREVTCGRRARVAITKRCGHGRKRL